MKINLPSLNYLKSEAVTTLTRFPFVLLSSLLAGGFLSYLVQIKATSNESFWPIFGMCCAPLSIAVSFLITLFWESKQTKPASKIAFTLLSLGIYFAYCNSILFTNTNIFLIRCCLYFLTFHLLIAAALHLQHSNVRQFWKFNENLFSRFLVAVVYSAIIFGGIAVILASVQYLFGAKFNERVYFHLFLAIAYIFHPWFFLSGVNTREEMQSDNLFYPAGIKILTQYVLVPLVTIYLVILYLYMVKIAVQAQLPKGNIGWLVSSYSVVGMFSLLLLFPIQEGTENRWVKTFSRFFYITLLPLVILLVLGTWTRIAEYGITEKRYYLLILGIWIGSMSLLYGFWNSRNIKWIPLSLGLLCLFTSVGPWGSFSVSLMSQKIKLERLLQDNGMLANGKIQKATAKIPRRTVYMIGDVLQYINENHGPEHVQSLFTKKYIKEPQPGASFRHRYDRGTTSEMLADMGLEYISRWQIAESGKVQHFYWNTVPYDDAMDVSGFRYLVPFESYKSAQKAGQTHKLGDDSVTIAWDSDVVLSISANGKTVPVQLSEVFKQAVREKLQNEKGTGVLATTVKTDGVNVRVRFNSVSGEYREEEDRTKITNFTGKVLVGF